MAQIIRPVTAHVNEIVKIKWMNDAGEVLYVRVSAPPKDTWKARLEEQKRKESAGIE